MIDKQLGDYIFECNICGRVLSTDQADFNVAITMMKRNGWNARKIGKDWVHGCDKCGNPVRGELL